MRRARGPVTEYTHLRRAHAPAALSPAARYRFAGRLTLSSLDFGSENGFTGQRKKGFRQTDRHRKKGGGVLVRQTSRKFKGINPQNYP